MTPANIVVLRDQLRPHATGVAVATSAAEAEDVMIVYVAGHVQVDPPSGPRLALARGDEQSRSPILELTWVAQSLGESPARIKVLILDVHLAGAAAKDPDAPTELARWCGAAGGALWVFATPDEYLYNQPGGVGTTFTGALLDVIDRPHEYFDGLDLQRLHNATSAMLRRESLPEPMLRLAEDPTSASPHERHQVAIFHQSSDQPSGEEIERLKVLLKGAGAAERRYYQPDAVVEAYRRALVTCQRVLGLDHPETMRARHQLAHWTGHVGDFRAAAYLFLRLYEDQRRVLGAEHEDTLKSYHALGYWSQQR